MKLKTKFQDGDFELGEVVDVYIATGADGMIILRYEDSEGSYAFHYKSLKELYDEWEDAPEEPKGYWYLDSDGDHLHEPSDDRCEFDNNCREIGNYFETEEECMKAVEWLKAITRLKNKGLVFRHHEESTVCGQITDLWISADFGNKPVYLNDVTKDDLDLLFSEVKNETK